MNTVTIGDIGESCAIAEFTKAGATVSKPLNNNARYDLIIEDCNNNLYRVQVKTIKAIENNKMIFSTKTTNYEKGKWISKRYTKEEVDLFFLYCIENNWSGLYIPEETIPLELHIRINPSKNNQKINLRLEEDYRFEKNYKKLIQIEEM